MTILGSVLNDFADYHDRVLTIKVGVVHEKCLAQEEYTQTVRTFSLENLERLMVLPAHGSQTPLSFFTVWYQAMFSLCKTRAAFMSVRQKFSSCANIDYGLLGCTDCFIRKKANKFGRRGYQKPYVMAI